MSHASNKPAANDAFLHAPGAGTGSGEPAPNVAGDALADQLQEMLDEAVAATAASAPPRAPGEADAIPAGDFQIETVDKEVVPAAVAAAPATAPVPKAAESARATQAVAATVVAEIKAAAPADSRVEEFGQGVAEPPIAHAQKPQAIKHLDEALAEHADAALTGDFETVDDVLHPENHAAQAKTPGSAAVESAAAPAEHGGDDFMLEGDVESLEQTLSEIAPTPAAPAAAAIAATVAAPAEKSAAPLAAAPALKPAAAPAAPAPVVAAAAPTKSAPTAAAPVTPADAASASRFSLSPIALVVAILTLVNRPFAGLSQSQRDLMGFIGAQLASVGLSLIAGARLGQLAGFATFTTLSLPLAWMLYTMLLRSPSPKPAAVAVAAAS